MPRNRNASGAPKRDRPHVIERHRDRDRDRRRERARCRRGSALELHGELVRSPRGTRYWSRCRRARRPALSAALVSCVITLMPASL